MTQYEIVLRGEVQEETKNFRANAYFNGEIPFNIFANFASYLLHTVATQAVNKGVGVGYEMAVEQMVKDAMNFRSEKKK